MTAKAWMRLLLIGALLLLVAVPLGVRQYRIAKTAAFCRAVGELAPGELAELADRCDLLMWERGGPGAGREIIRDPKLLAQFALVGRTPYEIVVGQGYVGLKYHEGHWSYSDLLLWGEDYSSDGDRIRVLKLAYGSYGWRVLCQRKGGHGEPSGAVNGSQPIRSVTNETPSTASSRR